MKRYLSGILAAVLLLALCACGEKVPAWQEQYDLGTRYLSEGNYEEAILAFQAAIEIEPKKAELYIGLADVYIAQGDNDQAEQVLRDALEVVEDVEAIQARMTELGFPARTQRIERDDWRYYWIYAYDFDDNFIGGTMYGPDGTVYGTKTREYHEDGSFTDTEEYNDDYRANISDVSVRDIYEYDASGIQILTDFYWTNGGHTVDTFDELGRRTSETVHGKDDPHGWLYFRYDYDGAAVTVSQEQEGVLYTSEPYTMGAEDHEMDYRTQATINGQRYITVIERDADREILTEDMQLPIYPAE